MVSSQNCCKSCCNYNCHRLIWYILIAVITICIMVGVDYGLLNTNKCLNTYAMFAKLFTPNANYNYLCYQNEIKYSLLTAFILMFTFHGLFAILLFHIIQFIIIKQKDDISLKSNDNDGTIRKPYNYHSPPISANTVKKQRRKKKKKKNKSKQDIALHGGSSSDKSSESSSDSSESSEILQVETNKKKKKKKKSKSVRKQKNKKYGAVNTTNQDEDGYGAGGTR